MTMSRPVPEHYRHLRSFAFGDSPALANELLELVVKGVKTATCSTEDEPNTATPGERLRRLAGKRGLAAPFVIYQRCQRWPQPHRRGP